MSAYMTGVLVCAAVTALAGIMIPNDGETGKYIKYISGLVSLSVIATPVLSVLRSPVSFHDFPDAATGEADGFLYDMDDAIISETERTLAKTIRNGLVTSFGVDGDEVTVTVELSRDDKMDIRILSVTVILTGYSAWTDTRAIERYITEYYDKDAEVEIRYE